MTLFFCSFSKVVVVEMGYENLRTKFKGESRWHGCHRVDEAGAKSTKSLPHSTLSQKLFRTLLHTLKSTYRLLFRNNIREPNDQAEHFLFSTEPLRKGINE